MKQTNNFLEIIQIDSPKDPMMKNTICKVQYSQKLANECSLF